MTDLCAECQQNNYAVFRSANVPESVKSEKLKSQELHLVKVTKARDYYKGMVSDSKKLIKELEVTNLQRSPPMSHNIRMHYSFDYAQQVMFPNDPLQPGPMYFLTPRKCGVFGICCEGLPCQINYLIDEGMNVSKGSASIINYLHHFFENYGLGEYQADLHCDNCSGQNKNRFVLNYLAWRTIHKLHDKITLNFLITGHTKFAPDWCFGLFKQRFRRTRINTLEEIADVVKKSTVTGINIPQIVGNEDGTRIVTCRDWNTYLDPYFRTFPKVKSYQHFEFDSSHPGVVTARKEHDSLECTTFQILKNPDNLPPAALCPLDLPPPGLDAIRQAYLHDNIRQYCDEHARDITCPKPTKKRRT